MARNHPLASHREVVYQSQRNVPSDERSRNRPLIRPSLHTLTPPTLRRQAHPRLRNDTPLGVFASWLFWRVRLLHHLRPPRQTYRLPQQIIHPSRSGRDRKDARLQRVYLRPRWTLSQYVRYARTQPRSMPQVPTPIVSASSTMPQPQQRP